MRAGCLLLFACVLGCPSAAAPDVKASVACPDGFTSMLGACIPYRVADTYCGRAATPQAGGACARKKCADGEALDVEHGLCLPESTALTLVNGRTRDDDVKRRVMCPYGVLTSHGSNAVTCAAGPLSCRRGERFVKGDPDAGVRG